MSSGGKHKPFPHIVRIVVVPRAPGSKSARHKDGHDKSHSLPDSELVAAENQLKRMEAPSPKKTSARRGSSAARFPKPKNEPKNMFEALKPTDIVAIGQEAASVRVVDKHGKPVSLNTAKKPGRKAKRRLFGHDDGNKDTVLRVWTKSDTIEYRCEVPFTIVAVEKAGWKIHGSADNPFANKKPYKAQQVEGTKGGKPLWVWKSSPLRATANNQQYKMTFKIGKELVDPDVVCGDPPPSS